MQPGTFCRDVVPEVLGADSILHPVRLRWIPPRSSGAPLAYTPARPWRCETTDQVCWRRRRPRGGRGRGDGSRGSRESRVVGRGVTTHPGTRYFRPERFGTAGIQEGAFLVGYGTVERPRARRASRVKARGSLPLLVRRHPPRRTALDKGGVPFDLSVTLDPSDEDNGLVFWRYGCGT